MLFRSHAFLIAARIEIQDTLLPPKTEKEGSCFIRTFNWDIRRSIVTVKEGQSGTIWSQNVAPLPPNVQDIIASGGLEKWVKKQIGGP